MIILSLRMPFPAASIKARANARVGMRRWRSIEFIFRRPEGAGERRFAAEAPTLRLIAELASPRSPTPIRGAEPPCPAMSMPRRATNHERRERLARYSPAPIDAISRDWFRELPYRIADSLFAMPGFSIYLSHLRTRLRFARRVSPGRSACRHCRV